VLASVVLRQVPPALVVQPQVQALVVLRRALALVPVALV